MNQEMSLRTPDPLSAFREGLGTRLVVEREAEGSRGSKPSPVKLSHFNLGRGSYPNWVRGIEFVYSRTSGPQDNYCAVDLA